MRFERPEDVAPYFEEVIGDEDDEPRSRFAADQGRVFYDHDWIDIREADSQEQLITRLPAQYRFIAENEVAERSITGATHLILYWDYWPDARSVDGSPQVWYLGLLNEQRVRAERTPSSFDVDDSWWTGLPTSVDELAELEQQATEGFTPAAAKLGMMLRSGAGVEPDPERARSFLDRASPFPELLHECLIMNSELGDGEAWFELWRLHERNFKEAVDPEARIEYLEKAADAGNTKARVALATLLMYEWKGAEFGLTPDTARAEQLLLANHEAGVSVDHQMSCLYRLAGPLKDEAKAEYWKARRSRRYQAQSD